MVGCCDRRTPLPYSRMSPSGSGVDLACDNAPMNDASGPQTFASPLKPVDLRTIAPEREALAGWLDYHRAELLRKLDGLTEEQAARRVVPSLTTLHGLVRHL